MNLKKFFFFFNPKLQYFLNLCGQKLEAYILEMNCQGFRPGRTEVTAEKSTIYTHRCSDQSLVLMFPLPL